MKGRVLVVDDDTALAEMIGIVLRSEGFDPVFCADGDEALGVFRATQPDLVLLDLMLPGKDGIEVCRQIRAESGVPDRHAHGQERHGRRRARASSPAPTTTSPSRSSPRSSSRGSGPGCAAATSPRPST